MAFRDAGIVIKFIRNNKNKKGYGVQWDTGYGEEIYRGVGSDKRQGKTKPLCLVICL